MQEVHVYDIVYKHFRGGTKEYLLYHARLDEVPLIPVEGPAVALDFDRTLGRVDRMLERIVAAAQPLIHGITVDVVREKQAEVEAQGHSFDPFSVVVNDELSDIDYRGFVQRFLTTDPDILYDDAPPLLERLQGIPHLVVTRAVQPKSQQLKLAASGYIGAARIVETGAKGAEIASWQTESGTYDFAGLDHEGDLLAVFFAPSMLLVDDLPESFEGTPPDSSGLLLVRPDEDRLPRQTRDLPPDVNVRSIQSLGEVTLPPRPYVDFDETPVDPELLDNITQFVPILRSETLTFGDIHYII